MKTLLKVLLWVVIVLAVVALTLIITAAVAPQFNSVWDLLAYLRNQIGLAQPGMLF